MASGAGVIVFNFGSAPGTNLVTNTVSDAGISATSKVEIYLMGTDSTVSHNAYEHSIFQMLAPMGLSCTAITAGVGFMAQMATQLRLTGTVSARYVWAD